MTKPIEHKNILFITNASSITGYGHLTRCLSLYTALKQKSINLNLYFYLNEDVELNLLPTKTNVLLRKSDKLDFNLIKSISPLIIIFDSYLYDNEILLKLRNISYLVLIDDNNDIYDDLIPNCIINGNVHAMDLNYKNKNCLLGLEYLMMNPSYFNPIKANTNEFKVLVTTGGSDPFRITERLLEFIEDIPGKKVCIIGPFFDEDYKESLVKRKNNNLNFVISPLGLKEYLQKSEFVISASGSTVYESIVCKSKPIIFSFAKNQEIAYEYFGKQGIYLLGKHPNIMFSKIEKIIENENSMLHLSLFKDVDGQGAIRVANYLVEEILRKDL